MRFTNRVGVAAAIFCTGFSSEAPAQITRLMNKFNDWSFYAYESPQTKICFAAAQPKSSEPAKAKRDAIMFYVSAWPKDGVKSEISIKNGYTFKKGSEVVVTIGGAIFKLFTKDERAFVADPAEELKLIETLRKGSSMTVEGTSERGTATKDTYSLTGLPQALKAVTTGCI